eukprot:EG_transcript_30383
MAHNTKLAIRDMAMQLPFEANRIEFEGQKEGGQKFKVLISFRICGTSTTRYPPRTFGQPIMNLKCPGLWDSLRAHTRYVTKAGTIKATERGVRTAVDATERIGWLALLIQASTFESSRLGGPSDMGRGAVAAAAAAASNTLTAGGSDLAARQEQVRAQKSCS